MELDKPRRSTPSTAGELFLCFSKSTSMRSNHGSFRGKNSPMIPPGVVKKKRGFALESNLDPSSPKVTCIGQVRMKAKKKPLQKNQKQQEEGGWCLQNGSQRWVHLPLTICETLKAVGSELSCFLLPCRKPSSCSSRSGERKRFGSSSCYGGALLRWLVGLQKEEGKSLNVELVTEEEQSLKRRSIFDEMEFNVDEICENVVPPKNALLLMRYGSDLSSKVLVSSTERYKIDEEEEEDEEENPLPDCLLQTFFHSEDDDEDESSSGNNEEKDSTFERSQVNHEIQSPLEEDKEDEEEENPLPDCLLLMMREPKLSMEVSKETWVSTTDFIGRLPECHRRHHLKMINPSNDSDDVITKEVKLDKSKLNHLPPLPPKQPGFQPARSSCSYPMEKLIEEKLLNAPAYEPLVLTRCKSEPMSSAATKFAAAPELA